MISLDEMSALARALVDADEAVDNANKALSQAKEAARILREETIPCAMQELGIESLTLDTGQKLSIKQEVYASIPESSRADAYQWLNDNGFGGLIKVEVTTMFAKGEAEKAAELYEELRDKGLQSEFFENVHAQTLKAFLKEQINAGNPVPLELFGARPVFVAKIGK